MLSKVSIKITLVILAFLISEVVSAKDTHEIKVESTAESSVNIRKGPGTEYAVVGQLKPGEWMWVYNEPNLDKEWVKASKMGVTGYVNTKLIRIVEESHILDSYKGLDFLQVPSFASKLKQWAWNLIVIFCALFIVLWIILAAVGNDHSFFSALSLTCTTCLFWYLYSLGDHAFWFADPDVSGGWWWTILYCGIFLFLSYLYFISSLALIESVTDDLDEIGDWKECLLGLCIYLIFAGISKFWIDRLIWIGYIALAIGTIWQACKLLKSYGLISAVLFLYTFVGICVILKPFLYILAFAAVFGFVALAFMKGTTNSGNSGGGSDQVQYEVQTEYGRSVIVTCSKYAPHSGYGDDGCRYEQLPNGLWRRV